MSDDLLENARQQASKARPSMRSAALLRIARAESITNATQARTSLLKALEIIHKLTSPNREYQLEEARIVAAAVDPALLTEIPVNSFDRQKDYTNFQIVQAMLAHGHVDAAFYHLLSHDGAASFPFSMVGNVLHQLDPKNPESAARRMTLLRATVEAWRQRGFGTFPHEGNSDFVRLFSRCWKELPPEEALQVTRAIVARVTEEPDTRTSAVYQNEVHFFSSRQNTLFQILHVIRLVDPVLAQSLVDSFDELSAAASRYPNGLQTMREEAEAEAERRKAEGATSDDGSIFAGNPEHLLRQIRLLGATRNGDFGPSIEDAMEKYGGDTSPKTPNFGPKEYWPSTGAFRTLFHQAGKRLGPDAAKLLDKVPDDDLRLFALIELAAALAGVPEPPIRTRGQRYPSGSSASRRGRIVASSSGRQQGEGTSGYLMRSPDGRLIRCPKCSFQPSTDTRWGCKCGHSWNTFWTSGLCPACHFQWEVTRCPRCHETSEHQAWYVAEP